MNNNWRFELYKHRGKIAIAASAIIIIAVLVVSIFLLINRDNNSDVFIPQIDYANYYVTISENNVTLYNAAGTEMQKISFNKVVYPQHMGDELIIYADDAFYKITAYEKEKVTTNSSPCVLQKELIFKHAERSIVDFVWSDKYIAVRRENDSFEIYNMETKTSSHIENIPYMEEYMLIDEYLIFSADKTINSLSLKTKEVTTINVGAETSGFGIKDGKLIAFNKFGNGNNVTSIFVLNPETLQIDNLVTETSAKVYPISFNSSYFVKGDSKLVVTEVGADGKFNSVTMNVKTGNGTFSNKNTIVMNNYVYTNKEGYIEVFSLDKKIIEHTVRVEGEYFCPLYVASN